MISFLLALSGLEPGVVRRLPQATDRIALLLQALAMAVAMLIGAASLASGVWRLTASEALAAIVGFASFVLLLAANYLTMMAAGADVRTPVKKPEAASSPEQKAPPPWRPFLLRRLILLALCVALSPWVVQASKLLGSTQFLSLTDWADTLQQGPWWLYSLAALALFVPFGWRDTSSALRSYEEKRVEQALERLRQKMGVEASRLDKSLVKSLANPLKPKHIAMVLQPFTELQEGWQPPEPEKPYAEVPKNERQKWIEYLSPESVA